MFKSVLLSLSALAALAAAQNPLFFTKTPTSVSAGQQYMIGYSTPDKNTPVTISIRKNNGDTNNLAPPMTLTSTSTGGSYTWNVPNDIASGSYAFAIDQSGQKENYSGVFPLTGGSTMSSAASSMMSSMTSMTSMASSMTTTTGTPSVMSRISASKVSSYPYGAPMPSPAGTGSIYGGGMGRNSSYVSPTVPSPTSGGNTGSTGSSSGSGSGSGSGSNGGSGGSPAAATTAATGGAASLGSSMALIIGAVAAFAFLN